MLTSDTPAVRNNYVICIFQYRCTLVYVMHLYSDKDALWNVQHASIVPLYILGIGDAALAC
jgi:heme/copper-type cytochrome/quinol oxidase subunit 4